jgi:hypothetical protein
VDLLDLVISAFRHHQGNERDAAVGRHQRFEVDPENRTGG